MSKCKNQTVIFPVLFRDLVFKSRVLVMSNGEALNISDGVVTVTTNEVLRFLMDHAEFEPVVVPAE